MSEDTNTEPKYQGAEIAWFRKDNLAWFVVSMASITVLATSCILLAGWIVQTWVGDMNKNQEQMLPGLIGFILFLALYVGVFRVLVVLSLVSDEIRDSSFIKTFKDAAMVGTWMLCVCYLSWSIASNAGLIFDVPVYSSGLNVLVPILAGLLGSMSLYRELKNRAAAPQSPSTPPPASSAPAPQR